jgi:hypothetical protein
MHELLTRKSNPRNFCRRKGQPTVNVAQKAILAKISVNP